MKQIIRKTLLYKTGVEYGDYTINHVLGCSHGCMFPCYAFNLKKRFGIVKNYKQWIEPSIVSNSLQLLDKELPRYKNKIKSVQLSFATDPFMMKYPEVSKMTIDIINRLNKEKISVTTLTKGIIPDEVFETSKINMYGITLVSLDEKFRKIYEPFSSNYEERIDSLKRVHDKGFKTWVSIEPYPTPNICKQSLNDLLNRISFVDYIVFGMWHYNPKVTSYKDKVNFYNSCADLVIEFCKKHKIKCHIKDGTINE